jgi:tRNA-splicing ligase RtcB (3'-phosphate/5'-hydroxy nucleic acid ligase)
MRKDSPIDNRARELCIEAGIDPESRITKIGSERGMPAWCNFRDIARAEINAIKQETAKQNSEKESIIAPQALEYQNSPLVVIGGHEASTIEQMRNCMSIGNTVAGVLCADGHLGYAQPVGGVIAYEKQISISGVGFDIACGCMAVRLDVPYHAIADNVPNILADIRKTISFGVGRTNEERVEHELFDDSDAWKASDMEYYRTKAVNQLGTVGSGNHYVDLMVETSYLDDPEFGGNIGDCPIWIGVHFGSRGLGHTSATKYLKAAGGKDGIHVPPAVVNEDSEIGQRYLSAMELAGRYAYAGREWVVERVRQIVGGSVMDTIHNNHNYAWRENHNGKDLWVVRKGATPAFPGQRGFVGGSMGDDAVIIEGVDSDASKTALYSTVHGAGRNFGRQEAKRRFTKEQMDAWLQDRGVLLAGGNLDESPMAYRRLSGVLEHHMGTIKVLHTLKPFAVAMAGDSVFDPFKD